MARPLPKDLETTIKGAASKAESRSSFTLGMMLGGAFGFGLGAAVFGAIGGSLFFGMGTASVLVLWFLAWRRGNKKNS